MVGFANSAPFERTAVLYIGVRDDGSIEEDVNAEAIQRKLDQRLRLAYPPIVYTTRVLTEDSRQFLCVLVPGSPRRPHFAGPAYVRVGSQTFAASDQQFDRLIAERHSKAYRILRHEGHDLGVSFVNGGRDAEIVGRVKSMSIYRVVDCSPHSASFRDQYGAVHTFALDRVDVLDEPNTPNSIRIEIRDD